MNASAAPATPMDPRLAVLIAAHDQTHRDLATLTAKVDRNHEDSTARLDMMAADAKAMGARITAEVVLINHKFEDVERNLGVVKDHVLLMTGKFGELDKKLTLQSENLTKHINEVDERLSTRLDGIDARLDTMDARFDGIDTRLDTIVELLTVEPRE